MCAPASGPDSGAGPQGTPRPGAAALLTRIDRPAGRRRSSALPYQGAAVGPDGSGHTGALCAAWRRSDHGPAMRIKTWSEGVASQPRLGPPPQSAGAATQTGCRGAPEGKQVWGYVERGSRAAPPMWVSTVPQCPTPCVAERRSPWPGNAEQQPDHAGGSLRCVHVCGGRSRVGQWALAWTSSHPQP